MLVIFTLALLSQPAAQPPAEATNTGPDVSKMPFTPDSIKQVMATAQPQIQTCYEDELALQKKKPKEGALKTSFIITAEGLVTKAKVLKKGTTLKQPRLHDCVVAVLSSLQFPKPPNEKEQPVEFPFNLKAVH